jgi:TRAP-type C4-dicarboxylate transport system permease small subunit
MNKYIKFMDSVNNAVKYILMFSLVVLAILVILQVTTRFVINIPLSWTEEIAKYLMIYIVFLGSGLAIRNNKHIAIDFLLEVVKPKSRERLEKAILWISAVFAIILAYFGAQLTWIVVDQSTPTLQYSMAWAYAAIPLGAILMLLNIVVALMESKDPNKDRIVGEAE